MKKFLGKKSTFITFLVLSIVMLAFIVVLCVRPVSAGMSYNGKINQAGIKTNVAVKVWGNTVNSKMKWKTDGKKNYVSMNDWVYRDGYKMVTLETKKINKVIIEGNDLTQASRDSATLMTKDEYKDAVKELKELKKTSADLYKATLDTKVSAFKMEMGGETLTCTSAIILVVVLAVVEAGFVTITVLAALKRKKK